MLADDVCYSLVEEISKQSMSNEYKKHNNIAHKSINNYFRGLTKFLNRVFGFKDILKLIKIYSIIYNYD